MRNRNILSLQLCKAEDALHNCKESINRIESSLYSKQGNVSKSKRMMSILVPAALILVSVLAVVFAFNVPLGIDRQAAGIVFLLAGISSAVFLGLQIVGIKMNDTYYNAVFEGIKSIGRIQSAVESYLQNLSSRMEQLNSSKANNWMLPLEKGPDYQRELDEIEQRILGLEQTKSKTLDKAAAIVYYVAAFSVALAELLVLQVPLTNLLYELASFGDTLYLICMLISVIGGPIIGTYYFHKCRGIGFKTVAFSWILFDGLAALAVCAVVIALIAIVVAIVMFVLQILLVIVVVIIAGTLILSILSGA